MLNFTKNNTAMTLVETTIALGILMMGILASITLMLSSFNYTQRSEQEIVVVNLAREGIEIMRSIRNSESAANLNDVDIFDDNNIYDNKTYTVDSLTANTIEGFNQANVGSSGANINSCSTCSLYFKNGQYTHDSANAEPTSFKRMVTILPGDNDNGKEKRIVSEVTWTIKGKTYTYSLEAYLTDWQ
jgi:Tfp pilus assembly protein PilV